MEGEATVTWEVLLSPHKWLFPKMYVLIHCWLCTHFITVQALIWGTRLNTNPDHSCCHFCSSWLDPSSEKEARGLSRSDVNLERRSKSMTHSRALKIASSLSPAHRTRFRTHSTCYKTGKSSLCGCFTSFWIADVGLFFPCQNWTIKQFTTLFIWSTQTS